MTTVELVGAGLFGVALVHTFSTKFFERMAHRRPDHAGVWHLLGEVEVVFGFWAMVLVMAIGVIQGRESATAYLDSRNFTEPMFVFAIMVIAGSRAVLHLARDGVNLLSRFIPARGSVPFSSSRLLTLMLSSSMEAEM